MAQGRKYTNLPDLDTSPDIYESQEAAAGKPVQDDSRSSSYGSSPASEAGSGVSDLEDAPQKFSRISRRTISTTDARSRFKDSHVDARGVDFSDRITNGRKSYRVPKSRRRRVKRGEHSYVDEYDFESDEEETFEERVARLKREVEEVKAEAEKRAKSTSSDSGSKSLDSIEALGTLLGTLQAQTRTIQPPRLSTPAAPATNGIPSSLAQPAGPMVADIQPFLHKTTAFESRLTLLESALGLSSLASIQPAPIPTPKNVLTTLSKLESQMATLASTTLPSLDKMTTQIHRLASEAERLTEARNEARRAREVAAALSPGSQTRTTRPSSPHEIDSETEARLSTLHSSLENISRLSPLLPAVLDRLKSLRVLHADAATVSERFGEAERLQARLGAEIERWKAAVEGLEGRIRQVEEVEGGNRDVVEGWVKKLEGRIDELEA